MAATPPTIGSPKVVPFQGPVPGTMPGTLRSITGAGNDPFVRDWAVTAMQAKWDVMTAVTNGSDHLRQQANRYLQQEPREDEAAWLKRVRRSVLTPYTVRLIENAAGLVLRRPIEWVEDNGDEFWRETFANNVDGLGSSINEFARRRLVVALAYGHSAIMVDYPQTNARTLREQLEQAPQPYWSGIDPQQILGWRQASRVPSSPLVQLRVLEWQTVPEGEFGEKNEEVVRILRPSRYEVRTRDGNVVESGEYTLDRIPVIPIYAQRTGMLTSCPPLLDIAYLNIAHYQRQADLMHSLHVAAMPLLVLEDWDEETSTTGVNYAIGMNTGSKAYYVQSDATSFEAQREFLDSLERQMSHLGVTKLLGQKMVAEAADAKRIDQQQANSVLAIISMELESSINEALALSAEYMGKEAPKIRISRDYDFYRLLGQDAAVLSEMHLNGQVTTRSFLEMLRAGEWLPDDHDINQEMEEIERLMEEKEKKQQEMLDKQMAQQEKLAQAKGAGPSASGSNQPKPQKSGQRPGNSPGASR